jgi:phasin family protein
MSQKPRTGVQARVPSPPKVSAKAAPVEEQPIETEETVVPTVLAEPAVEPVTPEPPVIAEQRIEEPGAVEPTLADPAAVEPVIAEPITASPRMALVEAVAEIATPDVAPIAAEHAVPAAAITPTKPTLMQGMSKMMKSTEDFVAFGQANLEAFVKSGQIWAAGVQELTKQMASTAKETFDESVSTFKAISTAKSVKEAIDLQSTFAKTAFEKAMAESNKLTDASIKLTEQTLAPITQRVSVAVETFGKAV